jgi:hypothetical protein
MAKISGQITEVKFGGIANLGRDLSKKTAQYDKAMQKQMQTVTTMTWNLAHQKRPYISAKEQKAGFHTKSGSVHHNKVSDPTATLGVPVAWKNGGNLQSSVLKEVTTLGFGKYQGKVWADKGRAPYALRMEYGDSKVHARPFLRPARNIMQEQVKKLFTLKIG